MSGTAKNNPFQSGYEQGFNDGKALKRKRARPQFVKALLSDQYQHQFQKGYREGYYDGARQARNTELNRLSPKLVKYRQQGWER